MELIIVIAIIAILAGAIFVAIDPARRLNEARNARRSGDVATILDAIKQYQADNAGVHYADIGAVTANTWYQIGTASSGCAIACGGDNTSATCVDISGMGTNYLAAIPVDPKTGDATRTHYGLFKDGTGAIAIRACDTEGGGAGGNDTPVIIEVVR